MASQQECEQALHTLAERMAQRDPAGRRTDFDRTLSCTLRDLDVVYRGRIEDGLLQDIGESTSADAQVRLQLTSDDLIELVDGRLNLATAWASGRIKVQAGVRDLMRLRSVF